MYKVGIIGCGRIAGGFEDERKREHPCTHAGAYKKNKFTKIVAIADKNLKALKKFSKRWKVQSIYQDYKKMLKKEKLDIISVCTHENTHSEIVLSAVKNKAEIILCEKPISKSIPEAKKMLRACQHYKKKLLINHTRSWHNSFLFAKKFIRSNKFGKIISIDGSYTSGLEVMGTHMIDMFRFLGGEIKNVFSVVEKNKNIKKLSYSENYSPKDPSYSSLIIFKNNSIGFLKGTSKKKYFVFDIDISFQDGNLNIKNNGKTLILNKKKGDKEFKKILIIPQKPTMMENLINVMVQDLRKKKSLKSNAEDALETLKIIKKIKTNKIKN